MQTIGELGDRSLDFPSTENTMAWVDPDLAELALVNVLRNAAQSAEPKGRVRIWVEQMSEHVKWIVQDDGTGIPEEVMKRLGQPFVTTRPTGTGMGLAVVRRIMEASKGHFSIDRAESGGARVVLEFPRPI